MANSSKSISIILLVEHEDDEQLSIGNWTSLEIGDPDLTQDQILTALNDAAVTKKRAAEQLAKLMDWMTLYLENGGELVDPVTKKKWYLGRDKTIELKKGVTPAQVFEAALDANHGDLDETMKLLSKGAIKYGASKTLLGEAFYKRFWQEVQSVYKKAKKPSAWGRKKK